MSIFYNVPPVGMRHGYGNILSALFNSATKNGEHNIGKIFGGRYSWFFSSGKSALLCGLLTLKNLRKNKNEVIVPAYICYSVAKAIEASGLKIVLCDLRPDELDFDYEMLANLVGDKTLCIIVNHLFGIPVNNEKLKHIANANCLYIIEDVAQGGCHPINSPMSADMRIFSFSRGKPISAMGGGGISTKDDVIAASIEKTYQVLERHNKIYDVKLAIEAWAMELLIGPHVYGYISSLPWLNIGKTIYPDKIILNKMSKFQLCLLKKMIANYDKVALARIENSQFYCRVIDEKYVAEYYVLINKSLEYGPVRYPILSIKNIDEISFSVLQGAKSLGVTGMYPRALNELEQVKKIFVNKGMKFEGAEWISRHLFTLPTHPMVTDEILNKIRILLVTGFDGH